MDYKIDLVAVPGTVKQMTAKQINMVIATHGSGVWNTRYAPDNSSVLLISANPYNTLDIPLNQGWSVVHNLSKSKNVKKVYVINAKKSGINLGFEFELQKATPNTSFKWSGDKLDLLKQMI